MIRGGLELASSHHEFTLSEFYIKTISYCLLSSNGGRGVGGLGNNEDTLI